MGLLATSIASAKALYNIENISSDGVVTLSIVLTSNLT